ncbi:MAG TPA: ferrochelatase [Alphaproteobacteria bacterium]|nr:ferrochelatase [Alphaproteobacteria bacterium]
MQSPAPNRPRVAVVLFNLGGPDRPEAVRPFLFNLFADPSILRVPAPLRLLLATLISRRRARTAGAIYDRLGGGSPLLPNTEAQARALEAALGDLGEVRVFIAMRYWHPMSDETAYAVKDFDPDEIVLLPLYPQFSTTTTASSLRVWRQAAEAAGLRKPTRVLCCYPDAGGFIEASARLTASAYAEAGAHGRPRVLFSAHGLPEKVVRDGDPYQWQCERTASAIVERLGIADLDWTVCYQSRVGPLKWIGPSTEEEIHRAGADGVPVVVAPIAFVSEHSETLFEIEIEYRELAHEKGVPFFARVPTVGVEPDFVDSLADLVRGVRHCERTPCSESGGRLCPAGWKGCPAVDNGDRMARRA